MTTEDIIDAIEQIQKSQTNFKIYTAVPMGVIMILYFFSFASLIDNGMMAALYVEIVTTILFILALIYLNKVSFVLVKIWYKSRKFHSDIIKKMTPASINKTASQLSQEIDFN